MLRVIFATGVLAISIFASAARAQQSGREATAQQLLTRYYACVRASAADQAKASGDRRMAVEQAFVACRTEENALRMFAHLNKLPWSTYETIVLRHQTILKREFEQHHSKIAPSASSDVVHRTKFAERLFDSIFESREALATAIQAYCTETSRSLPRNSQREDEELEQIVASGDLKRIATSANTIQSPRWLLQKALKECAQISEDIVAKGFSTGVAEAILWVKLEGVFDFEDVTFAASRLGVVVMDDKGTITSDPHGFGTWSAVRLAIRAKAILPLLRSQ